MTAWAAGERQMFPRQIKSSFMFFMLELFVKKMSGWVVILKEEDNLFLCAKRQIIFFYQIMDRNGCMSLCSDSKRLAVDISITDFFYKAVVQGQSCKLADGLVKAFFSDALLDFRTLWIFRIIEQKSSASYD